MARQAEEQQLGMWSPQAGGGSDPVRSVNWAGTFDPNVLLEELKSKPQDAIIEQIATGSMLRVMLLPSFHQITVMLSGIQCPSIRRGEDGNEDAAPFAREARFFVETRLLHREVKVKLDGVDKSGALFGSVLHPMGNMSIELVKVGLARVVDWSVGYCDFAKELRTAEREAKEKRLRIWRDYVPPNHGNDMTAFTARVAEIVSGDTVVRKPISSPALAAHHSPETVASILCQVVAELDGTERRVSLSSVRCPRPPGRDASNADPTQARENARNALYAAEAKELLRKTLIGKKVSCCERPPGGLWTLGPLPFSLSLQVKVTPEYKRNFAPEGAPPMERMFATVMFGNEKNAAELLIADGLATVGRTGQVRPLPQDPRAVPTSATGVR